jgi:hypothetical protein
MSAAFFRSPSLRRAVLPLGALALLAVACTPPSSYPDGSQVTAAQGAWCQALAKQNGYPTGWVHMSACKGAYPTASAAYLRGMTKCYPARVEAMGDKAVDSSQIVSDCIDEVTVAMPPDEAATREIVDARCRRQERCEKVTAENCRSSFSKLESAQRVLLTTRYNAGALHTIADCLSSKSCSDNEDEAQQACYTPVGEKLLWFPN